MFKLLDRVSKIDGMEPKGEVPTALEAGAIEFENASSAAELDVFFFELFAGIANPFANTACNIHIQTQIYIHICIHIHTYIYIYTHMWVQYIYIYIYIYTYIYIYPYSSHRFLVAGSKVRFFYPFRPAIQVLKGVSFKIRQGQAVGLVGPSGGGKSTVMSLIQRFYDPQDIYLSRKKKVASRHGGRVFFWESGRKRNLC